jgi:hypothetical protein
MPFGEYKDFEDCVRKNKDKKDPEAYCARIKEQIEGSQYMGEEQMNVSASMPIVVAASEEKEDNIFTIAAAKVGSKSFSATGEKYIFTKESLEACAKSWEGGIITLNHERLDDGVIQAAWFDEQTDFVMMDIVCDNPETVKRMRAGEATGVSIEASLLEVTEDNDIVAFNGTGVSIIFYPEQPACPLKDGCGILAKDQFESKIVTASEKRLEKINAKDYDLARRNDAGDLVKIDSVWTWDDDTEAQIEKQITNFVSFYGTGEYKLTEKTDTKIGDTVEDDESAITVSIDINKPIGGTIVAEDIETVSKADFDEVMAKNVELTQKLEAFEADEAIKAKDAEIQTLEAKNKELSDELDRRDNVRASAMIEEIKAWDAEFEPTEGMKIEVVETIHASLKRAFEAKQEAVKASEQEEEVDVTASKFEAPAASKKTDGLTIGGWVGGEFVQNV